MASNEQKCRENGSDEHSLVSSINQLNLKSECSQDLAMETTDAVMATEIAEQMEDYDVYIIHADVDEELVEKFTKLVKKFVKRNTDGQPITVCTDDSFLGQSNNKFDLIKWGFGSSRKHFVFLTRNDKEDKWLNFKKECAVVHLIEEKIKSLVVIKTAEGINLPFELGTCFEFYISRLLKGKILDEIDVDSVSINDLDERQLSNLTKLCNVSKGDIPPSLSTYSLDSHPVTPEPLTEKGRILQAHYSWLTDHVDPENGLLGVLFSKEVIKFRQMEAMKRENTFHLINEQLLKIIIPLSDAKMAIFEQALVDTNQAHILEHLAKYST